MMPMCILALHDCSGTQGVSEAAAMVQIEAGGDAAGIAVELLGKQSHKMPPFRLAGT